MRKKPARKPKRKAGRPLAPRIAGVLLLPVRLLGRLGPVLRPGFWLSAAVIVVVAAGMGMRRVELRVLNDLATAPAALRITLTDPPAWQRFDR